MVLALWAAAAVSFYRAAAVEAPGTIHGQVLWSGAAPARSECGPSARIGPRGGLAGALVYLEDIGQGRAPDPPGEVRLVLSECALAPPLAVAAPGAELIVQSRSRGRHPIQALSGAGALFWGTLHRPGAELRGALSAEGMVTVREPGGRGQARVLVLPHPYAAVTGPDGRFALSGVPPGRYTVVALHPLNGKLHRQPASLTDRGRVEIQFRFGE